MKGSSLWRQVYTAKLPQQAACSDSLLFPLQTRSTVPTHVTLGGSLIALPFSRLVSLLICLLGFLPVVSCPIFRLSGLGREPPFSSILVHD